MYDNATGWYILEELIYYMGNRIRKQNIPQPGFGTVIVETMELIGLEIKDATWGKLHISTNPLGKPEYTTDISPNAGAGYMKNHLEVDGSTKINGALTVNGNIFGGNAMYMNNGSITSMTWHTSSVAEYNGSRQFNIPIRATNAFVYLYFGDIGSHALFIKEGNSYARRVGNGGNNWDFCETNGGNIRCWYNWRGVGDRITAIVHWWN